MLPDSKKFDAVLDTDAYNEIDDQFALAYILRSDNEVNLRAVFAAPFLNERSSSPLDGMMKSYNEIKKILCLAGCDNMQKNVFMGSKEFLKNEQAPVVSDAAGRLIQLANGYSKENPLYVIAIGAITNIASALLMSPGISEKISIIWLGGHSTEWKDTAEFNMRQDVAAARVVFKSNVPLTQVPCMGVASDFTVSKNELKSRFSGQNVLCDYLVDNTVNDTERYFPNQNWNRVIWDVTAVACLLDKENRFMQKKTISAPIPNYEHQYDYPKNDRKMVYVYKINRDALLDDLVKKLINQDDVILTKPLDNPFHC